MDVKPGGGGNLAWLSLRLEQKLLRAVTRGEYRID